MNTPSSPAAIGTAVIVVQPATGKVLVGERRNSYKAGWLGLPGGRVETGERTEATGKRELQEETGLVATELAYVGVVKENQGKYDFVHFVYVATNWTGEPTVMEPEKCAGWQWLLPTEIDRLLPGHAAALQLWQQQQSLIEL